MLTSTPSSHPLRGVCVPARATRLLPALALALGAALAPIAAEVPFGPAGTSPDELHAAAAARVDSTARLPLADLGTSLDGTLAWEPLRDGRVLNLMRVVGDDPALPAAYANLASVSLRGGRLHPVLKQAMGLRVAMVVGSPYVAAHMSRSLAGTEQGRKFAAAMARASHEGLAPRDAAALRYAAILAQGPAAVTDDVFGETRRWFDDAELVELTLVVCTFDYFARLAEATALPVEPWALEPADVAFTDEPEDRPRARIAMLSARELEAIERRIARQRDPQDQGRSSNNPMRGLGGHRDGSAGGSGGAFLRCPDISDAWRATSFGREYRSGVSEVLLNFVSDAVSVQNGCHYCQTHQLFKLHNLGVSTEKMAQVRVSDAALDPAELVAVRFARRATTAPISVGDADAAELLATHGEAAARDIILQACRFNFMNRLTGALRLPAEENAQRVYDDVVGMTRTLATN